MGINKGYLTAKTDIASDEVYTPAYAVKPILKYLNRGNKPSYTIWCPFDLEDSEYVIQLRAAGYKVIASHIDTGQNFSFGNQKNIMIILYQILLFQLRMQFLKDWMNLINLMRYLCHCLHCKVKKDLIILKIVKL